MAGKSAPKKNLSALKRVRQGEKNRLRNRAVRTAMKTVTKKVEAAVSSKDKDGIKGLLLEATSLISKAVTKGIIHRNTASRKISRLARLANTLLTTEAA